MKPCERTGLPMYEGDNPIAERSQRMLLSAFEELVSQKGYADTTISEVCAKSGVSRQTFYKLFGSKEALVLYQLRSAPSANAHAEGEHDGSLSQTCADYAAYVAANWVTLRMLMENGLVEVLFEHMRASFSACRTSFVGASEQEREYASQFAAGGLCQLTCAYMRDHESPDVRELSELAFRIMSGSVYGSLE